LPTISAFAKTSEKALRELEIARDGAMESYRKHNKSIPVAPARKKYSGQFNVRIGRKLHRALMIEAAREGISLNALIAKRLIHASRI